MKLLVTYSLCFVLLAFNVQAYKYEGVSQDILSGLLPVDAAKRAHENDKPSQDVVGNLVDANVDVVKAVQTVAKEWGSCEDTYASVRKGVQIAPNRADEIVASVATMRGCHCNAQSFWARSRLEQRLRPRIQRAIVQVGASCSCASAGIEAAIELVPDQAEDMIDAVIVAKNRAQRTADSIGQIGKIPEQKYWGDRQITTKDTNLIRNQDICKGDYNEMDEFDPKETWANAGSLSNTNSKLGVHSQTCNNDEKEQKDSEENSKHREKLIISQYIEGSGSDQALEIYNSSNKPVDLLLSNYQLEVYFHGYDFPGEVIQLRGLIEPQSTFVIADAKASKPIAQKANQRVNGLVFKGADAVVLKTGFNNSPCECAVSTVASAVNNIDGINSNQKPISETKKDFIKRIEQHYENTDVQSTIVDSIGQILINKEGEQKDHPIVIDKTLRRYQETCKGDRVEMDAFFLSKEWSETGPNDTKDIGQFSKKECLASRKDLLLSEYSEGLDGNAIIEIFNGTDRPVDFSTEKYFLELYNDDDKNPEQRIYLDGEIDRNGVFVLASSDASEQVKDLANQTSGSLNLESTRAVVLKKVVIPAYQACYADISQWITTNELDNIIYTLTPINDPGLGPISGDDPRDGDSGGELASPN